MKVYIDSREQDRVQSATDYFEKHHLEVYTRELDIGDYVFTDGSDSVVFEFKSMSDFFSSITDNRVFNEAINQAEEYNHHFVLIHGDQNTRAKHIAMSRNWQSINLHQYLSAIASLNRYTTVIECYNPVITEAYQRMLLQANKCLSDKPIVRKFNKKDKNPAFNFLCYCVRGLNSKRAETIVNTFNLKSLKDLQKLTISDLTKVKGIGENTAKKIIGAING